MDELQELFDSLVRPTAARQDTRFAVVRIAADIHHLLGKDQVGFPAILIEASGDKGATLLRVELENLTVHPDVRCEVVFPDGTKTAGSYTLIRCTGDAELQALFFRLVSALLRQLDSSKERTSLAQLIFRLVDLFRALGAPPRKSMQGLWAELFVIARAQDPVALLQAWHADPKEIYDFNSERQRIEIKSSAHRSRVHSFRLEQLYPPAGTVAIIVSIVTERAGGGASLDELADTISDACATRPDLQLKLRTIVTETIGNEWRAAARIRFDVDQALATFRMYSCEQVPRLEMDEIPNEISNVRFDVALEDVIPIDDSRIAALGGLTTKARPRTDGRNATLPGSVDVGNC